jgi:hypothetical protein
MAKNATTKQQQTSQSFVAGARTPKAVRGLVEHLAWQAKLNGETPNKAHIHAKIKETYGEDLASYTTVRNIIDQLPLEPEAPWTYSQENAAAATLILPVIAALVRKTRGQRASVTVEEAHWIVRVRTTAPDLPPYAAYQLASYYAMRTAFKKPTDDLDAILAFAPWRGWNAFREYQKAVQSKWIEQPAGGFTFPAFPASGTYSKLLVSMGFDRFAVEQADSDYQYLLDVQSEIETGGSKQ